MDSVEQEVQRQASTVIRKVTTNHLLATDIGIHARCNGQLTGPGGTENDAGYTRLWSIGTVQGTSIWRLDPSR